MTAIVTRGNAMDLHLPDETVDLIVTSPPYFGLRSYQDGGEHYAGQVGDEATPTEYLDALIACTAEWMRVLKPGGSIFVNLGDKYAGQGSAQPQRPSASALSAQEPQSPSYPSPSSSESGVMHSAQTTTSMSSRSSSSSTGPLSGMKQGARNGNRRSRPAPVAGIPGKSLMMLPQRYAIRCIDELGLILRAEIVWAKPNGLPESVTDRVRRSHEQVFHFVKQPRYYAGVDEIREESTPQRGLAGSFKRPKPSHDLVPGQSVTQHRADRDDVPAYNPLGKLPGSVWTIPTAPLKVPEALGIDHFAAYPPELVRRIVLGWSPREVCTACGEGRRPVSDAERGDVDYSLSEIRAAERVASTGGTVSGGTKRSTLGHSVVRSITGYACACPDTTAPATPGVVLDPFGGTGTTALVASAHGRVGISVDLSADYCRLAQWRTTDPGERARVLGVAKPPPVVEGQLGMFEGIGA